VIFILFKVLTSFIVFIIANVTKFPEFIPARYNFNFLFEKERHKTFCVFLQRTEEVFQTIVEFCNINAQVRGWIKNKKGVSLQKRPKKIV
jgi:hypothetical protein